MKFSEQWLREWVNPKIDSVCLVQQLTMAGLEVDSVGSVADKFTGVVVGHVVKREPHPNADKLSYCQVDVGEKDLLNIVCGAANVRFDLKGISRITCRMMRWKIQCFKIMIVIFDFWTFCNGKTHAGK